MPNCSKNWWHGDTWRLFFAETHGLTTITETVTISMPKCALPGRTCRTNVANAVFAWLDVCSKTTEKKQRPSTTLTSQSIQPQYHAIPHPTITPMPQETGSTSPNIPQLLSNLPRPSTWPAPWGWSLHHFVPRRGTEAMCSEQGWKLRCKPSMCRWRMILQEPPHGLNNYVYYVYYIYVCVSIIIYIYHIISYHIMLYHHYMIMWYLSLSPSPSPWFINVYHYLGCQYPSTRKAAKGYVSSVWKWDSFPTVRCLTHCRQMTWASNRYRHHPLQTPWLHKMANFMDLDGIEIFHNISRS